MITLTAEFIAKEQEIDGIKLLFASIVKPSQNESGCIMYELYQDAEHLAKFIFIEKWASQASLDAHLESTHITPLPEKLENKLESGLKITWLNPVNG